MSCVCSPCVRLEHTGGHQAALADGPSPCCCARHCTAPPAGNGLRSGRKVLRKALVGQKLVDYYPPDPIKADPLMLNLKAEQ